MNGILKWLKDKRNNILIPQTLTSAVFNSEGKNVDELINNIDNNINQNLETSKAYTDEEIAKLVDSAPETLNTLRELSEAIQEEQDVVEALDSAITNKVDKEEGKGLFSGSYDDLTDTPTFVAGENVTISNDESTNKITISSSVENASVVDEIIGNNPTATNSTDGKVIYLNNAGYTNQNKPVFDGTLVQGYLNVTTGVAASTTYGVYTKNEIPCVEGDTVVFTSTTTFDTIAIHFYDSEGNHLGCEYSKFTNTNTSTVRTNTAYIKYSLLATTAITPTTDMGIAITVNGLDYIPVCPDYPQHIQGVADKGYFDGELYGGYYDPTTGAKTPSNTGGTVCSNNYRGTKENDVIKLIYEETVNYLWISFYDSEKKYLSRERVENAKELSVTAPTNAKYFTFTIQKNSGITPSTAKHICVTINGQYAVKVKTQNKNLCPTFEKSVGANASYYTDSFSVKGDSTYTISFIKERISGSTISNNNLYGYAKVSEYDEKMNLLGTVSGTVASLPSGIHKFVNQITTKPQTKHIAIDFNNNNGESALNTKVYNVQVEEGEVATPFEPHQESEALIPTSSPFYEGDYIEAYADGSGQIVRSMGSVVYDGDESFQTSQDIYGSDNIYSAFISISDMKAKSALKCTHFTNVYDTSQNYIYCPFGQTIVFGIDKTLASTGEAFKAWLQSNPIHVVYELAEPTTEPLTAEQVAEFKKLQTFKPVTHVTADGEVTMRYYCDNASGETVSMLQGRVEEQGNDMDNINNALCVFNYSSTDLSSALTELTIYREKLGNYDNYYLYYIVTDTGISSPIELPDGFIPDSALDKDGTGSYMSAVLEYGMGRIDGTTFYKDTNTGKWYIGQIPSPVRALVRCVDADFSGELLISYYSINALLRPHEYWDNKLIKSKVCWNNYALPNASVGSYRYATGLGATAVKPDKFRINYEQSYVADANGAKYALNTKDWTCYIDATSVYFDTSIDASAYTAYVVVEYTSL